MCALRMPHIRAISPSWSTCCTLHCLPSLKNRYICLLRTTMNLKALYIHIYYIYIHMYVKHFTLLKAFLSTRVYAHHPQRVIHIVRVGLLRTHKFWVACIFSKMNFRTYTRYSVAAMNDNNFLFSSVLFALSKSYDAVAAIRITRAFVLWCVRIRPFFFFGLL